MGTPAFRHNDDNPLQVFKGRSPSLASLPSFIPLHADKKCDDVKKKPEKKSYPLSYYKETFQGVTEENIILCDTLSERSDLCDRINKICDLIHPGTAEEANTEFFQHFFPISAAFEGTPDEYVIKGINTTLKNLLMTSPAVRTLYEENMWFILSHQIHRPVMEHKTYRDIEQILQP